MLFNKINCLDKGYVALVSSSNNSCVLKDLCDEFFKAQLSPDLIKISAATLYIKCPLFVQLNLTKFNFNIITIPIQDDKLEAYKPDLTEIGTKIREDNMMIADDIHRTTEALMINPQAYQHDGCNRFISQVIMPISTYTQILVNGSLEQWIRFISQESVPNPIYIYRTAVEDLLKAEWKNLNDITNLSSNRYK